MTGVRSGKWTSSNNVTMLQFVSELNEMKMSSNLTASSSALSLYLYTSIL